MSFPSRLAGRGLYAITNGPRPDLTAAVEAVLRGGARVVQYRDLTPDAARRRSEATALLALCTRHAATLLIEADIALAAAIGAPGVHVHTVEAAREARATLGAHAIIGVSARGSLETAQAAVAAGADYVSFGACFASPTLPEARPIDTAVLERAAALGVPRVAIGGITPDNAGTLVARGVEYVASISALFGAADIEAEARRFSQLFSH